MQYSLYKKLFISGILLVGLQLQCGKAPSKDPSPETVGSSCDKVKEAAILNGTDPSVASKKKELDKLVEEEASINLNWENARKTYHNSPVRKAYIEALDTLSNIEKVQIDRNQNSFNLSPKQRAYKSAKYELDYSPEQKAYDAAKDTYNSKRRINEKVSFIKHDYKVIQNEALKNAGCPLLK